jgi:hypothetical protein
VINLVLDESVGLPQVTNALAANGVQPDGTVDRFGHLLVEFESGPGVLERLSELEAIQGVVEAEPVQVGEMHVFHPNDPAYTDGSQWALHNLGDGAGGEGLADADIDAPEAWDYEDGSSVRIGVLDGYYDSSLDYPELPSSRFSLRGMYLPELTIPNIDHAWHVLGILAAETDNNYKMAGIAHGAEVYIYNVFHEPEYLMGEWNSLQFKWAMYDAVDEGCTIINFSGGMPAGDANLEAALDYAAQNDVLVVVSAGNSDVGYVQYPGRYSLEYDNVICVGGTDFNNEKMLYSCYGTGLTMTAPGYLITSMVEYGGLRDWTGTSMAAPAVSGVAGLVRSRFPSLTAAEVKNVLIESAYDPEGDGWTNETGWGIVNAGYAVAPPPAPLNLHKTSSVGEPITLQWSEPAPDAVKYCVKRVFGATTYFYTTDTTWTDPDYNETTARTKISYTVTTKDVTGQWSGVGAAINVRSGAPSGGQVIGEGDEVASLAMAPTRFEMVPPSPNPFNASTVIRYGLPSDGNVKISVYDLLGRRVTTLIDAHRQAGWQRVVWNAGSHPSGTYFIVGDAQGLQLMQKITVVK